MEKYYSLGATLEEMTALTYPVTLSCYNTVSEYYQMLEHDSRTMTNLSAVTYNVFHNAPKMYDTTDTMIGVLKQSKPKESIFWSTLGEGTGLLISYFASTPI